MESKAIKPSLNLLCKLGSIIVHAEEGLSDIGHEFDITTLQTLLLDPEVKEWLYEMSELALIPQKRNK